MSGIRKQAPRERVAPSARGTLLGSWSFAPPPAWRAKDEIRAPATLVEATLHATADAGSIPAVSIRRRSVAALRKARTAGISPAQRREVPRTENSRFAGGLPGWVANG